MRETCDNRYPEECASRIDRELAGLKMAVTTSDLEVVDLEDPELDNLSCAQLETLYEAEILVHPPTSCSTDDEADRRQEAKALAIALGGPHADAPIARAIWFGIARRRCRPVVQSGPRRDTGQRKFEMIQDSLHEFQDAASEAPRTTWAGTQGGKSDGLWTGRQETVGDFIDYATTHCATRIADPERRRAVLGASVLAAAGARDFRSAAIAAARAVNAMAQSGADNEKFGGGGMNLASETAQHEGMHAAVALCLEGHAKILSVELAPDNRPDLAGRVRIERPETPTVGSLIVALAGPLGESNPPDDWPPPTFESALEEKREELGRKLREGRFSESVYYQIARLTLAVTGDPEVRLKAYLVAEALEKEGFLTGREVERLLATPRRSPEWPGSRLLRRAWRTYLVASFARRFFRLAAASALHMGA